MRGNAGRETSICITNDKTEKKKTTMIEKTEVSEQ